MKTKQLGELLLHTHVCATVYLPSRGPSGQWFAQFWAEGYMRTWNWSALHRISRCRNRFSQAIFPFSSNIISTQWLQSVSESKRGSPFWSVLGKGPWRNDACILSKYTAAQCSHTRLGEIAFLFRGKAITTARGF